MKTMTVAELIEKLSALSDQNVLVDIYNDTVVGIYVNDDGSVTTEHS